MRKLLCILLATALGLTGARAQVRTYNDNTTNTFIFGLENYYYGVSGQMEFQIDGKTFQAVVSGGQVLLDGSVLESGGGDAVIGIHDFTGDRVPDLVVASRSGNRIMAEVYTLVNDETTLIGRIGAEGEGITDIRVFRQAITIKNHKKGAMYTWTWHKTVFDFKASDGSADPTPQQ